jgi:hypothetical protein
MSFAGRREIDVPVSGHGGDGTSWPNSAPKHVILFHAFFGCNRKMDLDEFGNPGVFTSEPGEMIVGRLN